MTTDTLCAHPQRVMLGTALTYLAVKNYELREHGRKYAANFDLDGNIRLGVVPFDPFPFIHSNSLIFPRTFLPITSTSRKIENDASDGA